MGTTERSEEEERNVVDFPREMYEKACTSEGEAKLSDISFKFNYVLLVLIDIVLSHEKKVENILIT